MGLPHFTTIASAGLAATEPVYTNLFEITFTLPASLSTRSDSAILNFQATKISLNTQEAISTKEQKYKFSTRVFMLTPEKTHTEFSISFNVNVNDAFNVETWNVLRAWYDLVWNSQTGSTYYKSDIIGSIIVNQHDKKGVILRRVTFNNCQIKDLSATELDWESAGILNVTSNFVADYWEDEFIDDNRGIGTVGQVPNYPPYNSVP
jgi:hypothetical protein